MTKIAAPMALTGLVDAHAMARKHPSTFSIPPTSDLDTIMDGSLVKICRNNERFWVLVHAREKDRITGEVNNRLVHNPDLPTGTMVTFKWKNVFLVQGGADHFPDSDDFSKLSPTERAEQLATKVARVFSGSHPEVQMSWEAWMCLADYTEMAIKEALGLPISDDDDDDSSEPVTVQ